MKRAFSFFRIATSLILTFVLSQGANADELRIALPSGSDAIQLLGADARWQLVVTRVHSDGQEEDVTRSVSISVEPPIAQIDATGFVKPLSSGIAKIVASVDSIQTEIGLSVEGMEQLQPVEFFHQVVPIFTKYGCNGGGCHGKASGQGGFKLSLLGFEPQEDYERLVVESRGRRIFPTVPEKSLLLLKAAGDAPHGGGQRFEEDSHEYRVLRRWIAGGAPMGDRQSRKIENIEMEPRQRSLSRGAAQQLSVWVRYADGKLEDITRTAQFESNRTDLAQVDAQGFVQLGQQPGDVSIMARYQGHVTVFGASIPLGREVNEMPPSVNLIDEAAFAKLKTLGIPPSPICDDATYIRRVTLDVCGRLPTAQETLSYVESVEANKVQSLVDRLLASQDHADFFARKWVLILRNGRKSPGNQLGSFAFHQWLCDSFYDNKPYDRWVRELLTASGSIQANPAVTWWREVESTESRVEDSAQLFLGQRLQCARCHHHPFEKWSQADYFRYAAFFSKVGRKEGQTADNPIFVSNVGPATAHHPKSGEALAPSGLDASPVHLDPADDPRQDLVDWMVDPTNPFFARSLVNRYWKHFMGSGLVEPEDDMRVTNPPTNPGLLDDLARSFVQSGFDLRALMRLICTSSTYRLSSDANQWNINDTSSYSRFYPKRLQAEVLLDAIDRVVMTHTHFDAMPSGTRAVQLPDTGFHSYFLDAFGRPSGATACECERSAEATLAQSLHLLNSKDIAAKLSNDAGRAATMCSSSEMPAAVIEDLYRVALSRPPNDDEMKTALAYVAARADNQRAAYEDLVWAVINSKEFLFNH